MLDHPLLEIGLQYSAQKIEPKDTWIELGGIKSGMYSEGLQEPSDRSALVDSDLAFSSHFLSYTYLEINPKSSITDENISIEIDPDILQATNQGDQNSKSNKIIRDFGFKVLITSKKFTSHQEGWLQRHVIKCLNQIHGIEYLSFDYLPTLRLHYNLSENSLTTALEQIASYLIRTLKSKFAEIDQIAIEMKIGAVSLQSSRNDSEEILISKRKLAEKKLDPSFQVTESTTDFLAFPFDQSIAPYSSIILTPWTCDPTGYLFYSDFSAENFSEKLFKKYGLVRRPLGDLLNPETGEFEGINDYFSIISFHSILRVELWGLNFPLPGSPNSEIIIFPIPNHDGLGVLNSKYTRKVFHKISVAKLKEKFGEGHQYKRIRFISKPELVNLLKHEKIIIGSRIKWMNSSLLANLNQNTSVVPNILSHLLTENQVKSVEDMRVLEQKEEKTNQDENFTTSSDGQMVQIDEVFEQTLMKIGKEPIHLENVSITLASKDGHQYELEFTNFHLKADAVKITKKNL